MKEFLIYIHAELSQITSSYKLTQKFEKEDYEMLDWLGGTLLILEGFATKTNNRKLHKIVDNLEYSIGHIRVTFKAEAALNDVQLDISQYE